MYSLLLCSTPVHGHVVPLLPVARELVRLGHDVRFLTGARYRDAVEQTGARWVALPAEADYDDRDMDAAFPGRVGRRGVAGARFDLRHIFLEPATAQLHAIDRLLDEQSADAVLAESLFFGAMLLMCRHRHTRVPVINLGIVPLALRSRHTAPFALGLTPRPGRLGELRNTALTWSTDRFVFHDLQRDAESMARRAGLELPVPAMNYPSMADAIVQFSVADFEYPRPDVTTAVHFVGPASLSSPASTAPPPWWDDLDGRRPLVHVTQGTVANADLDALVLPTLRALAERDVLVVATTGGRDLPARALPDNARIAPYLPYDKLFPRLDALVTNGGYGGVHFALAHGVPIVACGDTEDKAEVAARVAWSGAGVRLRPRGGRSRKRSQGRLDEAALAAAVDDVLANPSYRSTAERLGAAIRSAPGPAGVVEVLDQLIATPTS